MSQNMYIGISKNQLKKLNDGEVIGKRPYIHGKTEFPDSILNYDGTVRIFVRVLSEEETAKEQKGAFFDNLTSE